MILEYQPKKFLAALLGITLVCVVAAFGLTEAAPLPPADETPQTSAEPDDDPPFVWPEGFQKKIDWQFSDEDKRLFDPPLDATIAEMREWMDKLERPIPADTEKWGGFKQYREKVAYLRINIADQIIATHPDDRVFTFALAGKWFPYFILAKHDPAKIPEFEAYYRELKEHNNKHGKKLDYFTSNVVRAREAIVRDLMEIDKKKYLPLAEELLAEYDEMLRETPLGKDAEEFYNGKQQLLYNLAKHEEKYKPVYETFCDNMREVVQTRENELETTILYYSFGPNDSYRTPEGQKAHRDWLARINRKIATETDPDKRYHFYCIRGNVIDNLLNSDAATEEELLAHVREIEKFSKWRYGHEVYNDYYTLFYREFSRLNKSETITDEALAHLFQSARHMLYAGESGYGHGGIALDLFTSYGEDLYNKCTPEQKRVYLESFSKLIDETEKVEKEWIAAGKPMHRESELPPLRKHLDYLQLQGKEVSFTAATVDGKPFDIQSLRGKVVLLDFWATWCGPCIREIPDLKRLYAEYHDQGFEIVGISIDKEEDKQTLIDFIAKEELPWTMLHDPNDVLFNQFYGSGVPHCLLLDRDGKVMLIDARGHMLQSQLERLFGESKFVQPVSHSL